ncbi:MAG: hypothetical protein COB37_10405 [Kordiimonadales bacterium]|nr:MAG: hypothetical protein COB37_10405 [Kordiimonadales bacterium]
MGERLIVTSAAYCDPEMQAEIGKLPPSFLPLGNKRLYEFQFELAKRCNFSMTLTLPKSYIIPEHDKKIMADLGIEVIALPDKVSMGQSALHVLNILGEYDEPIHILRGDTLFDWLPGDETDIISVATSKSSYRWTVISEGENCGLQFLPNTTVRSASSPRFQSSSQVVSGYYSFSRAALFLKSLEEAGEDFIGALSEYHKTQRLKLRILADWRNCGHLHTYFHSRTTIPTQRSFNEIQNDTKTVIKSSPDSEKMAAEVNWFDNLPERMRIYAPTFLGPDKNGTLKGYAIENLNLMTLSDLFVFGNLEGAIWDQIILACSRFLSDCQSYNSQDFDHRQPDNLYLGKTLKRLEEYQLQTGFDLDAELTLGGRALPPLREIAEVSASLIQKCQPSNVGIMHGDFCFSNVFFDFRSQSIKVIDPRGFITKGQPNLFGDTRYDVGKLHHSIVGFYDFIVAGRYKYSQHDDYNFDFSLMVTGETSTICSTFLQHSFGRYSGDDPTFNAMSVLLFLSMLPLHYDKPLRQKAFLANAARLFTSHVD